MIVFSVIAFALPFPSGGAFWMAYCFGMLALCLQIYVFEVSFAKGKEVKSKFYGFPIARIGVIYLAIQVVLSFVEMALANIMPAWVALSVNIVLLALAMIGCVSADMMRDEIIRQDVQLIKNVSNMRELQSMTAALAGQCEDSELKKLLQKVADEFRFSDPVSADATMALESELKNQAREIQQALIDEDYMSARKMTNKMLVDLKERNRVCGLSK